MAQITHPQLAGRAGTILLDAELSDVHRDRDFGRIEARVTFLVKRSGEPVKPFSVLTNVAARGALPVRHRLVSDAARLAEHMLSSRPAVEGRAA